MSLLLGCGDSSKSVYAQPVSAVVESQYRRSSSAVAEVSNRTSGSGGRSGGYGVYAKVYGTRESSLGRCEFLTCELGGSLHVVGPRSEEHTSELQSH